MELKQLKLEDINVDVAGENHSQEVKDLKLILKGPMKLTSLITTSASPTYKKLNYQGDTEFTFSRCYQGKRQGVIVCLEDALDSFVEVPLIDIQKVFIGGSALIKLLTRTDFKDAVDKAQEEMKDTYSDTEGFGHFSLQRYL